MQYILAIDQGTTSTTVVIIDENLRVCGTASCEFPQLYPQPDFVEHNPDNIWQSVLEAIGTAIARARIDSRNIAAIGITNQRETTTIWEKKTGKPIYNAIVWQCRRTTQYCASLKERGLEEKLRKKTGLFCDPYFSATKIRWILDHTDTQKAAEAGELCFGTVDTWILWQLTGGRIHATDPSNASRTLLMDLSTARWDDELLDIFNIPAAILPKILDNNAIFGRTWHVPGLPDGIPIAGMLGDQQAALFGQCCFEEGEAKCTFGTGAFLLLNTGTNIIHSEHGLLSTCAWKLGNEIHYALEGSAFVAGALVQWLRDGLGIIKSSSEIEALAKSVDDDGGVILVPALTGLGAPHWRPSARGLMIGMTRATTKGHIARAALMGICQQNTDLLEAMISDLKSPLTSLKVDGGASIDNLLMQMQADLLDTTLIRPENLQTTALGAAMCASLGIGLYQDIQALRKAWKSDVTFVPEKDENWRSLKRKAWNDAIQKA
ncbi:MAG: glycerol kinase GlpK [Proteobacteria bacterium]|nr:glycerol kinase GlpK [Pseudomonadota bacterium]